MFDSTARKNRIGQLTNDKLECIFPVNSSVERLVSALNELLIALELAEDVHQDPWQFAIDKNELRDLGLSDSDMRWLICKGFIYQSHELTKDTDERRVFKSLSSKNLRLLPGTCFVLSRVGSVFLQEYGTQSFHQPKVSTEVEICKSPFWDRDRHELWIGSKLIKRYRWPARNQELILDVFQEDGWPTAGIDDPLPPHAALDPKQRLRDTIRCLNRFQQTERRFLVFRGDGTGKRVIWDFTEAAIVEFRKEGVEVDSRPHKT